METLEVFLSSLESIHLQLFVLEVLNIKTFCCTYSNNNLNVAL